MNSEENRLRTFTMGCWPENAPVDPKRIAKAGFYFTGRDVEVQCFSCGSRISEWNYGDKVMARHKALDPRCPFVLNPRQSGNLPVRAAVATASGSSVPPIPPLPPLQDESDSSQAESRRVQQTPYDDEAVRLASFDDWPIPSVVSPAKLAAAGFYYTNIQSKVICAYCDGMIVHWNPGDDPELIHQKCYPSCNFINDRLKYRIYPYTNVMIRDPLRITQTSEVEALKSLGVYYHRIPKNPKFSTTEARLMTFRNWSSTYNQKPEALAEAGFYYTGFGDKVRCFHCDGGLKDWKKSDSPWLEHARWYSDCSFLLMVKGPEFVQEMLRKLPEILKKEMDELNNSTVANQEPPNHVSEETLKSLMNSPAALAALGMGIEASRVKCALRQKLATTGKSYHETEADLLIFACMEIQSEEGTSGYDDGSCASPSFPRRLLRARTRLSPERSDDSENDQSATAISQSQSGASSEPLPIPKPVEHKKAASGSGLSLEEENRLLKEARLCKVCLDRDVVIVFLPCAHLVTCSECAQNLKDCPLCRQPIKATVRTFLS